MFNCDEDDAHNCPECEDDCDCGDPDDCLWCSYCASLFEDDWDEEDV